MTILIKYLFFCYYKSDIQKGGKSTENRRSIYETFFIHVAVESRLSHLITD